MVNKVVSQVIEADVEYHISIDKHHFILDND